MSCIAPANKDFMPETPYSTQQKVAEVSLNGVDWTTSRRSFTFYDPSQVFVSLLEPEGGPTAGGTAITIHGGNFRNSSHLKCTWDDNVADSLKVNATFLNQNALACISPPISSNGSRPLEIALDDFHFTGSKRMWTYYALTALVVSALDPIGGPAHGGTRLQIIGTGFDQLGGARMHGSSAIGRNGSEPHRRIGAGSFCKFSIESSRMLHGEDQPECASVGAHDQVVGQPALPVEGAAATMRAASSHHLRNFSCFTLSSTPSLARLSAVVEATYVSANLLHCESPAFAGKFSDGRATLSVHVTSNGDYHDLASLSVSSVKYMLYDPREARIQSLDRVGGPINGSTLVKIKGKLFSDFSLKQPGHQHVAMCKFGSVGVTLATVSSDTAAECFSPRIYGIGHQQVVSVDLTLNGQHYLEGAAPRFVFSPRDHYAIFGECHDAFGALAQGDDLGGSHGCLNNFTGVAVRALQPYGGPALGGTLVTVSGRYFAVRGPSILCKFGTLEPVIATFLNESAIQCLSPPSPGVTGAGFVDHFLEVTLNGDDNFLTSSSVPFAYYNHQDTLAVSAIYPRAGPKTGGNTITVYGSGFRVLGGTLGNRYCNTAGGWPPGARNQPALPGVPVPTLPSAPPQPPLSPTPPLVPMGPLLPPPRGPPPSAPPLSPLPPLEPPLSPPPPTEPPTPPLSPQPLLPPGGVDGSDSRVCSTPLLEAVNRGLQCVFSGLPAVPAFLVRLTTPEGLVGDELICQLPQLSEYDALQLLGTGALPGSPVDVCVEVTLNGNRTQGTQDCVRFTYYDA